MRIWYLLLLLSLPTSSLAYKHWAYPFKIGEHWGLVNSRGRIKVVPTYNDYVARGIIGLYAFVNYKEGSDSVEFFIFDSLGHQILHNKDSIYYHSGRYKPRRGSDGIDVYVMKLCGYQPLPNEKKSRPEKRILPRSSDDALWLYRIPYGSQSHREEIGVDEHDYSVYKMTFMLPKSESTHKYSFLRKLGDSLYLANIGGELEMTFEPTRREGCVTWGNTEHYSNVKGGNWGIVSASGRVIEPFVHKDQHEIVPFGFKRNSHKDQRPLLVIVHSSFTDSRSKKKVKVLNQWGETILEREGIDGKTNTFSLFERTIFEINGDNFKEFYFIDNDGAVQDSFDRMIVSEYWEYVTLKNGAWTLYDQYHQKITSNLDVLSYQSKFLNSVCLQESKGDSTWMLNVFTNQSRWVPSKQVYEFSGDYIKYKDAEGEWCLYSISQGHVVAKASKLDRIPLDGIVWSTDLRGRWLLAVGPQENCDLIPYQNALALDGFACVLNDSFILNRTGTFDTLLGRKLVGTLGGLSAEKSTYYSTPVYQNGDLLFKARYFELTKHKNFAILGLQPSTALTKYAVWFPKRNRIVLLHHFRISHHWDLGGCLLVRGRGKETDAKWLLFNEDGRLIRVDQDVGPVLYRIAPKRVDFYWKMMKEK